MDHLNVKSLATLVITLVIMITIVAGVLSPFIASAMTDYGVTPEISALLNTITIIIPIGTIYVYVRLFKETP